MRLKPHPKYKDSRIEWLGELPEGWETKVVRHIGKIVNGSTPDSNNEKYWDGNIVSMEILDASEQITEPEGILCELKGKEQISA